MGSPGKGSPGKDRSRTVRPKVALRGGIARDHLADADHFMWSIPSSGLVDDVPAWRAFTGQEPLDVRGYGWLEAVASDERAGVKDAWVRAVATRALFDVTCRVLRHDGVYRDLTIHGMPLFDTHHRLRRWVGSCQDVTERKAQGQEQRERGAQTRPLPDEATLSRAYVSNESFSRLLESNIIGFGIVDTEQVLEANDALLQMLGATRQDVLARQLPSVAMTAPEYVEATTRAINEALETGACQPFEKAWVRRDGTQQHVLVGSVLLERDPPRFLMFVVDLEERKRLEHALGERAAQLGAVFEAVTDALVVYDTEGHVILSNAAYRAQVARFIPTEPGPTVRVRNAQIARVTDADGRPLAEAQWPQTRILQGETLTGVNSMDMIVRTPSGEDIIFVITGAPLRDAEGRIIGAVCVNRDVTDRTRLEREREEAYAREMAVTELNTRLDDFFALAAHEIRNPAAIIKGNVDLALRRVQRMAWALDAHAPASSDMTDRDRDADADGESSISTTVLAALFNNLRTADAGSNRLTRLVERLFDVANARTGTIEIQLGVCDLAQVVSAQVETQSAAAPHRSIQLSVPDGQPILVTADAERLGQVLENYLNNAMKYSADDRAIEVRLSVVNGEAVVSVCDHGPGLPPEERNRVWEPFHRVPGIKVQSKKTTSNGSLGLGLYICERIIDLHRGRVGVESVEGHGSAFWFALPLVPLASDSVA